MKSQGLKIYSFFISAASFLAVAFSGILLLSSLLGTCYSLDMTSQEVLTRWDNPLFTLMGLLLFVSFFFGIRKWVCAKPKYRLPLLFAIVLLWCMGWGILLILFSKTVPAADAWSVYSIAESLAQGNTSVVHHTDSYLSYYPQQVGLVTFFELLIRIWNLLPLDLPAYHFIKCVYVLLALAIIYFQYRTVALFSEKPEPRCNYLLLIGANLPFIMYTSFVYGEIPSFVAISAGIYYYFRFLKNKEKSSLYGIISFLCFTLSVFLRKNSLIVIIALLLVTLLQWFKEKRHALLLFAAMCALSSIFILPLTQKYLELRADNYLRSGVPAMSYFAMGMQESSRANGWYNGFNFNTYQESGMDTELTNTISKAAIEERLAYFKAHPSYAGNFYLEKYLSQWVDGTYASRQATLATFGGRRPVFDNLYTGTYSRFYIEYCNAYQNLLYLGLFLFCLQARKAHRNRKNQDCSESLLYQTEPALPIYVGIIATFGGFLFHMIWEANSRYIFLYSLLLLPYAAHGITLLNAYIDRLFAKKSLRIMLCCLGSLIVLILGVSLWWYFRTSHYTSDETRQNDLAALNSQDYNCLLLSMYSVENLDPENFIYFRGIPTLKAGHSFESLKDIGDYLECAYGAGQDITSIYMGIDPAPIAKQYGHHASLYHPEYEQRLASYVTENPQTHFEFLLPYYSLEYWANMSDKEREKTFTAYRNFINIFAGNHNVTIYFFGHEEWLIAGHGNYEAYNSCNESVTSTLLAMTIRDDTYQITAENMEERLTTLDTLISQAHKEQLLDTKSPPYSYDLSDCEFVFFGDSVIGNYTDSLSIPGVVAGNGNTKTYNLGQGGTTATMVDGTVSGSTDDPAYGEPSQSLQTILDAFLAKNPSLLNTDSQPKAGLMKYLEEHTDVTNAKNNTCFVINYGLNDYFEGHPVTDSGSNTDVGKIRDSVYSYQGSLRTAVQKLTAAYPDCTILLLTPNFCSYYENGTGKQGTEGGVLTDYVNAVKELTEELSGEYPVYCIDNYNDLGIDASNHGNYLSDGCHPNEKGRFGMGMALLEYANNVLP